MAAYATAAELEASWRPLSEEERARADALLADASAVIDAELRGRAPDPLVASVVARAMARRSMASPGSQAGIQAASMGAGDYTESWTYANPTGDLYLTASERRMLGMGRGRAAFWRMGGDPGCAASE